MPRQPRDLTGRFVPTRDGRQQGNFKPKEGDTAGNMMRLAEMAHVLSEAIEALIQPGRLGGAVAIGNYFDWVYAKYDGKQGNEQPATPVFGSRIKSTAKSNRISRNFDDTPIPFNTRRCQNGAGGNKRGQDDTRDSDEDDDFSRLIKPQPVSGSSPEGTVIIEDSVEEDGKVYQVFWLISADQAILFGDETCAAAFSIGLKQVREGARKYLSLSDAARLLGVYKDFVLTMDLPLNKPFRADPAVLSLINAIAGKAIFNNPDVALKQFQKAAKRAKAADYKVTDETRMIVAESELYTVAIPVPIAASLNGRFWFPYAPNDGVEAAQTLSIGIQKGHSWALYRAAATVGQNNGGVGNENEDGGGDGA
ncbi:hypothetical protein Neosp_006191 [[Neocosmospora] mangrovei]